MISNGISKLMELCATYIIAPFALGVVLGICVSEWIYSWIDERQELEE